MSNENALYPALIVNWLTSPEGTRHRITKFIVEDAIKQRKLEQDLLNEVCIPSMLARLDLLQKGYKQ
ncbi:hypothetical protein HJ239_004796 [Escherichia coli]|nr:hypothetical protein [Escherichia coli]